MSKQRTRPVCMDCGILVHITNDPGPHDFPAGIEIDGVGVGPLAGVYHLDCLDFCGNCTEVETVRWLREAPACRVCLTAVSEAMTSLWESSGHDVDAVGAWPYLL